MDTKISSGGNFDKTAHVISKFNSDALLALALSPTALLKINLNQNIPPKNERHKYI